VYLEKESDWELEMVKQINKDEHDEMFKFGLNNLNSTEDASSKNCTEVSDILGPFNSTLSAKDELDSSNDSDELEHKISLVD
jgi:hypothetical protein